MSKLMKIVLTFFTIVVLVISFGIYQAKTNFAQAYDILEEVMAKAETGQEETEFFISEQAWENWANQSVYGVARQPLPWEEFKEVVGQCDGSLLYEKGGSIPAVLQNAGDTYRSITMECVDSKTGDVSGDSVRVLLEKVDGNWRIVGQGNRN